MSQRKFVIAEKWDILLVICLITGVSVFGTISETALAQKVERSIPNQQRTLALAEDEVKQLMLMLDADKSGKISKQEFMRFMGAEFDRLDKDKSGELDLKELAQSQIRPSRPAVGK
jgi:Ca2+-binding EF-hand superfamily protein